MKKLMDNKWTKLLFATSIILSAIPSIATDLTYGHQGVWTHYGMVIVGVLYFIQSGLWAIDVLKDYNKD